MKEILDNWKQFISEQSDKKEESHASLHDIVREKFNIKSPSKWQQIKKIAENYNLKKISDAMKNKIYNTFKTVAGESSFVRLVKSGKWTKHVNQKTPDEEILQYYNNELLPEIKKMLEELPVVNLASKEAENMWKDGVEYAAQSWANNRNLLGFYAYDKRFGALPPFVGINPYSAIEDQSGIPNVNTINNILLEEFAHAIDLTLEVPFSTMLKSDLSKIAKQQKDTGIEQEKFYDYLKKPIELYAKLKVIKTELQGVNRELFFDDEGRIVLRHLKSYLENPRNKDRHEIIRILNIQKLEDIGKVLDQIARVSPQNVTQKTSQMA
tara:strand:- start:96 stop:1067 length:972 start_codon:yes stop_codon:yes gene_type:complete